MRVWRRSCTNTHTIDMLMTMYGICLRSDIYGFYCLMLHFCFALLCSQIWWLMQANAFRVLFVYVWVCSLHWHNIELIANGIGYNVNKKSNAIILNSCTIDGGRHTLSALSLSLPKPPLFLCLSLFLILFLYVVSSFPFIYIHFDVTFTSCLPSLLW